MDALIALVMVVGIALAMGLPLGRFYREAKLWKEVHATWGSDQPLTVAVHTELARQGVRCKLKVIGTPDLGRMLPQRMSSVRVHRNDVAKAFQIIHAMKSSPSKANAGKASRNP
jgi:hypothetical protein